MTDSGDASPAIIGTATNWAAPAKTSTDMAALRRRAGQPGRRGRRTPCRRRTPRVRGRARGRRPRGTERGSGRRSGDRHRVSGRPCRALQGERVEGPRELVRLVGSERLEVEVLVDEDAVHGDPDGVAGERQVGALARHRLHRPGIAAHHTDLLVDQPSPYGGAGPGAALVELGGVLLPQLAVAGTEQHGVALARLADPLSSQRRSEEHTSELQSLAYLVCRLLLEKKKKNTLLSRVHSDH